MNRKPFARNLVGIYTYINLINELSKIHNLNSFYVVIKHRNYDYRIVGIYDMNLNKLKYPKNFSKTILDAEPELGVYFENSYGKMIQGECGQRDLKGYLCYRVSINPLLITISSACETIAKINNKNKSNGKNLKDQYSNYDLGLTKQNKSEFFLVEYNKLNSKVNASCEEYKYYIHGGFTYENYEFTLD